jgi:hypothetical protein
MCLYKKFVQNVLGCPQKHVEDHRVLVASLDLSVPKNAALGANKVSKLLIANAI